MSLIKGFFKVTIYQPLFNALIFLVWLVPGDSVGWAIILLTILVRLALYPSNASMIRSQRAVQALQPEIDRIREEFKDDQQAQAKATMELYQSRQVNPFASCLVLLIQLPILGILYHVFTVGLNTDRFDLLYALTPRPEQLVTLFAGVDLAHPSLALGIVAGIVQFLQSRQMMAKQPAVDTKQNPQLAVTQQMLYLFPILTVIISLQLPAALALYWIVQSLAMMAQQWWMHRLHTDEPVREVARVTVRHGKG